MAITFQTDFDAVLGFGDHAEDVSYTPSGSGASTISAFVKTGDVEGTDLLGVIGAGQEEPKLVQVSKTDVPTVTEHEDTVTIPVGGTVYRVKKIIVEDPAAFWLYCLK